MKRILIAGVFVIASRDRPSQLICPQRPRHRSRRPAIIPPRLPSIGAASTSARMAATVSAPAVGALPR